MGAAREYALVLVAVLLVGSAIGVVAGHALLSLLQATVGGLR